MNRLGHTTERQPNGFGGCLLLALAGLAAMVLATVIELHDPLKMMLEWELLAVFVRPQTHGWYRTVIAMVGMDVAAGVFIVAGAGWLLLLAWRRSARFPVHLQAWLLAIVAMRTIAWLVGDYMSHAIAIAIAIPCDGFVIAVVTAVLIIPYLRQSQRVRNTFIAR
ncbi:DUF2569 domain-containing protein [Paraburkholderia phenazinium]|jgi:hypothetical protein|uniref:DUF2569 family protein n=1 Tax=Paraburkholderia phenazinium TaxID=60549 RepID=A0A1G8H668_9BURK|nr:DUF2569 domain-containing protein [Paraburkholderia phenazinium]SDI02020.1 Protein of unknown function [Paraburkholderia phenazinium]